MTSPDFLLRCYSSFRNTIFILYYLLHFYFFIAFFYFYLFYRRNDLPGLLVSSLLFSKHPFSYLLIYHVYISLSLSFSSLSLSLLSLALFIHIHMYMYIYIYIYIIIAKTSPDTILVPKPVRGLSSQTR